MNAIDDSMISTRHLGKRKRNEFDKDVYDTCMFSGRADLYETYSNIKQEAHNNETPMICVNVPYLAYPKSLYVGHEAPLPISHELDVLKDILVCLKTLMVG